MATAKGAMTTLSSSQTPFLSTVEEPEKNRINFRDSLKFFQEQLVINGANFPSPSSGCQSGNSTLKRTRSLSFKENILDKNKTSKDNDTFQEEIQTTRSCKIAIPTVDTILESVRVLRAIQKSQEERGSFWNLDVSSKSNIDPYINYKDNEIPFTNDNQNDHSNEDPNKKTNNDTDLAIAIDKPTKESLTNDEILVTESEVSKSEADIKTDLTIIPNSKAGEETCSFWPSNSLDINTSESEDGMKESPLPLETKNEHVNGECYKTVNESAEATCERELSTDEGSRCEEKQNYTSTYQLEQNDKDENSFEKPMVSESQLKNDSEFDGKHNDYENLVHPKQNERRENLEVNSSGNVTKLEESNSDDGQNNENLNQLEQNGTHKNLEHSRENDFQVKSISNSEERQNDNEIFDNEITSSKIQLEQNGTHKNPEHSTENDFQVENISNSKEQQNDNGIFDNEITSSKSQLEQNGTHKNPEHSTENDFQVENISNSNEEQNDNKIFDNEIRSSKDIDKHKNIAPEIVTENKTENKNPVTEYSDTTESIYDDLSFRNNQEDANKETLLNKLYTKSEQLKIETYDVTDAPKSDIFILNGSHWKESCSPNDRSSIKTEPTDSDSGFGTQRSGSSLSPNNYSHMQKDSWSDSCSSQYASAECSPYHSLSSVFECSSLLSTGGETKAAENVDILSDFNNTIWEDTSEKEEQFKEKECDLVLEPTDCIENCVNSDKSNKDISNESTDFDLNSDNAELDTEISYCNFIPNYTIKNPCKRTNDLLQTAQQVSEACDNSENKTQNEESILHEQIARTNKDNFLPTDYVKENEDDSCDLSRTHKFTAASCDLTSIVQSLYAIKENPAYQILPAMDGHEERFEEELLILSKGAFCEFPEDNYLVIIEDSNIYIKKDSEVLCSLNMKYGEISKKSRTLLEIDNKMGKCVYIKSHIDNLINLKTRIEINILRHWQTDCLQLVHYPLKCHQNVVIIDLGSCSTRAGILMDQPTLPSLFFPTICATNKTTGTNVYGMEALQSEVRQHSNLSFPVRPTIKITKHTIDIDLLEGLFKKIFSDLKIDPTEYIIQVCLPRNLSINAQTALMSLLLEDLKVKAVNLSNQALLTLYAYEVSTAVVVDIGDRIDVLPVVDGFIVENGVTKLPHGGQRLIHHMKHGLAEKRISLSNEIDSFVVEYIIENLAYVAENYEKEIQIATQYPERIKKTVMLEPISSENLPSKTITLEEARFKIPEGLFNPDFWGLDSPGIHHLVHKAIQATSVDARKQIAENIFVSGGVTMLPGFVERLSKEMIKLSKTKILPKVHASNYRHHCTYIGACKLAKMDVFSQVCVNLEEYSRNGISALKKCALCF